MSPSRFSLLAGVSVVALSSSLSLPAQDVKPPKISSLPYLANAKRETGTVLSFYVNDSSLVNTGATGARKVSGTYSRYEKMTEAEYHIIDSLCRTLIPAVVPLPSLGDTITVYYGGLGFNKTFAYTGFVFEKSSLSMGYKVPVRLEALPIFLETIDSMTFGDGLSIDRYALYGLMKVNLLPVNTAFIVQEKTGQARFPLNTIDETDKHYTTGPKQTVIIISAVGCVTVSTIAIILLARETRKTAEEAEETAIGCMEAAEYFFTWGDEEKSCTGLLYKR